MPTKLTTQEFIDRARAVHGDRYCYAFSVYQGSQKGVLIHCTEHHIFEQRPNRHLMGAGCPKCGVQRTSESKLLTNAVFISRAMKVHDNKYDYSLSAYKTNYDKLKITCKEHGIFLQTPNNHLAGNGCPGCAKTGFDRTKTGFLYVLRSDCGTTMKIGITHNPKQRHNKLKRDTPFSFTRIELIEGPGEQIAELEKELLAEYQPAEFMEVFDGSTEWCLWNDSIRHKLLTVKTRFN